MWVRRDPDVRHADLDHIRAGQLEVIGAVLLTSVWLLILATGGMTNGGERSEVKLGSCGSVRRW